MRTHGTIAAAAAIWALSALVFAADWPQWLGPQRDGVSQETGLLEEWPEAGPRLLWRTEGIGDGYAAPSVVGDRIYILGNEGMENEFVQALAVEDGTRIWSTRLGNVGNPDQNPNYPKARSTPTVDGDVLYAFGSDGDLVAMETETGEVRWRKNVREEYGGRPAVWDYAESPLVDGDVVAVTPGGAEATIVALDKQTGETVWTSVVPEIETAAFSSIIPVETAGRRQYVQLFDRPTGVDATTGEFLWSGQARGRGPTIPSPVVRDNLVYFVTFGSFGGLMRLTASGDGVAAEQVYYTRNLPSGVGGAIRVGDNLYGANGEGLVALDFATGDIFWQAEGIGPGSVMFADGMLYVHGNNGNVALVEATPEEYREKGRFTPPDRPESVHQGESAWAYPVVANGRLYIRELGVIWCYDVAAR